MLARALTVIVALASSGCSMPPGPKANKAEIAQIERASVRAPGLGRTMISYLRAGDALGRRVIFVHGTPGEAEGWADFLLNVPPGCEYVAVDRPGFGATIPHSAQPSLERQALAIAPLLETRSGKLPILVGHSLGGPIVARVAIDQPGRVGGIIILAGSLDPALERVHPMQPVGEWWGIRHIIPRALRNANRELIPLKRELEAMASRLAEIRVAVTIIHGTDDPLVPVANVGFMRARLTQAAPLHVQILKGQNHFLPWERRDVIETAIAEMVGA